MSGEAWKETFMEQKVSHVLERQGRVVIVEHVPAGVCAETGAFCKMDKRARIIDRKKPEKG